MTWDLQYFEISIKIKDLKSKIEHQKQLGTSSSLFRQFLLPFACPEVYTQYSKKDPSNGLEISDT